MSSTRSSGVLLPWIWLLLIAGISLLPRRHHLPSTFPFQLLPVVQALDLQAAAADLLHEAGTSHHRPPKNTVEKRKSLRGRSSNNPTSRGFFDSNESTLSSISATAPYALSSTSEEGGNSTAAQLLLPLVAAAGTLHVTLFVGQPPQPQVLIVDTGSHLTAWSCSSKPSPYAAAPPYHPSRSSTHQVVPCGECRMNPSQQCSSSSSYAAFPLADTNGEEDPVDTCLVVQKYTEGSSWTAYEASELVTVAAATTAATAPASRDRGYDEEAVEWTVPFAFGCQTSATGLFRQQYANGILGLERSPHSLLKVWQRHGLLYRHAFSLCTSATGGGGGLDGHGGIMGVGGPVAHLHVAPMRFTPLVRRRGGGIPGGDGLYSVRVTRVWLGRTLLVSATTTPDLVQAFARGKGTLLDSGTTDTFFPRDLASAWADAWERLVHRPVNPRSQRYTHDEFLSLPAVTLEFEGGLLWTIPPQHYLEGATDGEARPWPGTRELTNRLYVDEAEGAVLGLNAHRGHDVLYDADGGRVGVAPAACG